MTNCQIRFTNDNDNVMSVIDDITDWNLIQNLNDENATGSITAYGQSDISVGQEVKITLAPALKYKNGAKHITSKVTITSVNVIANFAKNNQTVYGFKTSAPIIWEEFKDEQ